MIVYSHPRSGSTAFLKIVKWLKKNKDGARDVLDLGEWLNFGAMHNTSENRNHSWIDRGREKQHKWRPFYQTLVQHFVYDEKTTPIGHTYCVVDTDVFDMDFDDPDFLSRCQERWITKGKGLVHGDPVGHPLKEVTRVFDSRDEVLEDLVEQYNLRVQYLMRLKKHGVSFVAKHFPNPGGGAPFFVNQNLIAQILPLTPQPDDVILIANDLRRATLSLAILHKYERVGTVHNYQDEKPPLTPLPNKQIGKKFLETRIGQLSSLYDLIEEGYTSNILTKDDLFVKQAICINNTEYNLTEYFDSVVKREFAMRYTEDLSKYFDNSNSSIALLHKHMLEHYPNIVKTYLKL